MADGSKPPTKFGKSTRMRVDGKLFLKDFTGEIMLKHAYEGAALLLVVHADGHQPDFQLAPRGLRVT